MAENKRKYNYLDCPTEENAIVEEVEQTVSYSEMDKRIKETAVKYEEIIKDLREKYGSRINEQDAEIERLKEQLKDAYTQISEFKYNDCHVQELGSECGFLRLENRRMLEEGAYSKGQIEAFRYCIGNLSNARAPYPILTPNIC